MDEDSPTLPNFDRPTLPSSTEPASTDGEPTVALPTAAQSPVRAAAPVERLVGQYEIIRELGRGGMGTVYLARRTSDFRQKVAIKFLHPSYATHEIEARFERERQILASLQHPAIARLVDGGSTPSGAQYIVMDYVDGVPLHRYCAERSPSLRERLEIFLKIASAVHSAHQKLVVHRDLKPPNILVLPDGSPKLLDFGIAKLLGGDMVEPEPLTHTGFAAMTPEYASPEQVRGEPVTTATDIYSLGVILYTLLTGRLPYPRVISSVHELLSAILEAEPARPSSAATASPARHLSIGDTTGFPSELRGDLDAILLTALDKDPRRRYPSAQAFADDIRRYLDGEPVSARPATGFYLASKFVRRNRGLVVASTMTVLALTGGAAASLWQARIATAQRTVALEQSRIATLQRERAEQQSRRAEAEKAEADRQRALAVEQSSVALRQTEEAQRQRMAAERRTQLIRRLSSTVGTDIFDALANSSSTTAARQVAVSRAVQSLDAISNDAGSDPDILAELAAVYIRLGEIQGSYFNANLGQGSQSIGSCTKAIQLLERAVAARPAENSMRSDLGLAHLRLGDAYVSTGDLKSAAAQYRLALSWLEALPINSATIRRIVTSHTRLASVLQASGDSAAALTSSESALNRIRPLAAAQPTPDHRSLLALSLGAYAQNLSVSRRYDEALATFEQSSNLYHELRLQDPGSVDLRRNEAGTLAYYAVLLFSRKRYPEALAASSRASTAIQELSAADTLDLQVRSIYAFILLRQAQMEQQVGQTDSARRLSSTYLAIQKSLAERPGATANDWNSYADGLNEVPFPELRNPAVALSYARRAVEDSKGKNLVFIHTLTWAYFRAGQVSQAIDTAEKALATNASGGFAPPGLRQRLATDLEGFRKLQPANE